MLQLEPRRVATLGVATVICIAFVVMARMGTRPQMYPGDKTEVRACQFCGGTGVEAADTEGPPPPGVRPGGPCVGCRGAKNLTVIIPGPKHPAWVKGTVRDEKAVANLPVEAVLAENQRPMQKVVGAIPGARLTFEGQGKKFDVTANLTGRFKIALEPGHYSVKIGAKDFQDKTDSLDVAPLQNPIWPKESARLVTPEQEADITRVDYLLTR
jgi:hypothetical protein